MMMKPPAIMEPLDPGGIADMVRLTSLNENSILDNLKLRYTPKKENGGVNIYTYVGSILVAINPYRPLGIHSTELMMAYRGKRIGELPPHIYAIADSAYADMLFEHENKCCIISGESGAGKTETAKSFLQYLAAISENVKRTGSIIEEQVVQTNTILESFGCAVTVNNDNSSRFGKYFNIGFDRHGQICGASVDTYMLELSRVVQHSNKERNFHVFYRLVNGATPEEKSALSLSTATNFSYLKNLEKHKTTFDVHQNLEQVKHSMNTLMFTHSEQDSLFSLIAGILHIGNVWFSSKVIDNLEVSSIKTNASFEKVQELLGFSSETLTAAFTTRTTYARGETLSLPLTASNATTSRDTLAKNLYERMFTWVAGKLNAVLRGRKTEWRSIGVLDIYGFEVMGDNSFEQLCINFWNEHLQQFFIAHIFKMEQHLYQDEGIEWREIGFVDNQRTLDLLSEKPLNVFAIIDDIVKLDDHSDADLMEQLNSNHFSHPDYIRPRVESDSEFGIRHFAGNVIYNVHGFVDKNRDTFTSDLQQAVITSSNPFLVSLYNKPSDRDGTRTRKRTTSLAKQFRTSLRVLLARLRECGPYFVRCIKPNEKKLPNAIDDNHVLRQLKYCGLLATIEIRKAGYPVQREYADFSKRYKILLLDLIPNYQDLARSDELPSPRLLSETLCNHYLRSFERGRDYAFGKSRLFLKDLQNQILDQARVTRIEASIKTIQTYLRGALARAQHKRKVEAMETIRARLRTKVHSKQFRSIYNIPEPVSKFSPRPSKQPAIPHPTPPTTKFEEPLRAGNLDDLARHVAYRVGRRRVSVEASEISSYRGDRMFDSGPDPMGAFEASVLTPQRKQLEMRKAELRKLKMSVSDMAEVLNSPPLSLAAGAPFEVYANDHFRDPSALKIRTSLPTSPLLKETDKLTPKQQELALCTWTVLMFYSDYLKLQDGRFVQPKRNNNQLPSKKRSFFGKKAKVASMDDVDTVGTSSANAMAVLGPLGCDPNSSNLQLVQQLILMAVHHEPLRDELFCQITCQLMGNTSSTSMDKCWLLLGLYAGCVSPSEKLAKGLTTFIRSQERKSTVIKFCYSQISTWFTAEPRQHPPNILEFQAAKVGMSPVLSVQLPDGGSVDQEIGSRALVTTICSKICEILSIKDIEGWALYISSKSDPRIDICLNSSFLFVHDAITSFMDHSIENHIDDLILCFKREFFPPWHQVDLDPFASELTSHQVFDLVASTDVLTKFEDVLVSVLAQRHYLTLGPVFDYGRLSSVIDSWMPRESFESHSTKEWCSYVERRLSTATYATEGKSANVVVASVSKLASVTLGNLFVRTIDSILLHSNSTKRIPQVISRWTLKKDRAVIVASTNGQTLLEIPYYQIVSVEPKDYVVASITIQAVSVSTLDSNYIISGTKARFVLDYLKTILDGLRRVSRVAVVISATGPAIPPFSTLKSSAGDVILFESALATRSSEHVFVQNLYSGEIGKLAVENVFVLATILPPTDANGNTMTKLNVPGSQTESENSVDEEDLDDDFEPVN